MGDYIDRTKIRYTTIETETRCHNDYYTERYNVALKEDIINMPAADVVEVVRCQDCKHCSYLFGKSPLCMNGTAWRSITANDFCAWGERITKNG